MLRANGVLLGRLPDYEDDHEHEEMFTLLWQDSEDASFTTVSKVARDLSIIS
jgi:hypothetical protein